LLERMVWARGTGKIRRYEREGLQTENIMAMLAGAAETLYNIYPVTNSSS